MSRRNILRSWNQWILLGGLLFAANRLAAGGNVMGSISSVNYFIPGSEQYLFFAPGDPTRSQVKVNVTSGFSASASILAAQYRFVARLLDSAGNPVSLRNGDGSATLAVTFPQFSISLAAGTGAARPDTLALALADGVRLDPNSPYRVEVTLQYLAGGAWASEGPVRTSSNRRFYHFLNQTSGDAPYNVIAEIISVVWKRTHAIDSTTGDHRWLEAEVAYRLHRYDNFTFSPGPAVPGDNISVRLAVSVRTGAGANVAATVDAGDSLASAPSYREGTPRTPWTSDPLIRRVRFHPDAQLASGTETDFRAAVTISHVEFPSTTSYETGNTVESESAVVLHFNGQLQWGGIITTMLDFANDPTVGLMRRASDVSVSLQNVVATTPGIAGAFTTDPVLQVALDNTGTARVLTGNGQVTLADTERTLHGLRYEIPGPIHLGLGGADADVTLRLPAGMGVGKPGSALNSRLTSHLTAFSPLFEPVGTNSFPLPADERVVLDTHPLYFPAPELKWVTLSGELQFTPTGVDYVRRDAFEALASAADLPAEQTSKPSNERYYQFVTGVAGTFTVHVTPAGRTGLSAKFTILPGQFVSHFPLGVTTAWSVGQLFLQDDLPVGVSSGLVPAEPIAVAYEQGCPDGGCAGQTAELACDLPQLFFTPDGGLVGEGTAAASAGSFNSLRWGTNSGREVMAHEVGPFQKAAFAMSGHVLLGGALPPSDIANGVGVLLDSGATIAPAATPSGVQMIRPGTTDYANGVGHYAGLNLNRAVETDPASVYGIARLGDAESSVNFPLSPRVKYYARRSGVSGLHEASAGGFLTTLNIYRYPFEFKSFGLGFLANKNVDSETRCEIKLPAPVNDRFTFDRLTFTCVGAPDKALIAEGLSQRIFQYWSARIDAQGVEFVPRNREASACDASQQRFLGLGSVAYGQGIDDALAGTLYLSPEGDIITPADSERPEGVSFYLGAGSTVAVAGLDNTTHRTGNFYRLTLGKAYFNHPDSGDRASVGHGWLNLFGGLKLPFYGSTPVHLTTLGTKDVDGVYHINGGWVDGVPASDPTGDPTQRGLPPEVRPDDSGRTAWQVYRGGTSYPPFAHGEFLDVVDLGFPLQWFPDLREFSGVRPVENTLLIIQTSRELNRLSASDIAISLGVAYEGFPRIHLTSEEVGLIGCAEDFATAVARAGGDALPPDVRSGFKSIRSLAGEQLQPEFRALAGDLVRGVAPGLRDAMRGDPALLATRLRTAFAGLHLDEHTLLLEGGSAATALRLSLVSRLDLAAASLRSLWDPGTGIFRVDPVGRQLHLAAIIREILSTIRSPLPDSVLPSLAPLLAALTDAAIAAELGEDTKRVKDIMFHVAERMDELRARYASDSGDLYLELRALFADPAAVAELNALLAQVEHDLLIQASQPHWVEENVTGPGDYFERQLVSNVGNKLVSSEFFSRVDRTLEYHLRSIEEEGVSAVDGVAALLQRMINRVGRLALGATDDLANNLTLDAWDDWLGFFNADGYVFFSGDEVRRLRVSARGGIKFARGFDFSTGVQFEMKALDSEGEPSCATRSPGVATECLLGFSTEQSWGVTHSPPREFDPSVDPDKADRLDPLTTPVTDVERGRDSESFELHLKATFDGSGSMSGFGGGFSWASSRSFQAVKALRVSGDCMFSPTEQYIAGSVEGNLGGGKTKLQGGMFVGHTCSLDPIKSINSDFASALGDGHEFTGVFVYVEGWYPVVSVGCWLNLSLGLGAGVYVDVTSGIERIGGTLMGGASGEVLCILAATGTLRLTGSVGEGGFVFAGDGDLRVRLGYCPFCVRFGKHLNITYKSASNEWELQ